MSLFRTNQFSLIYNNFSGIIKMKRQLWLHREGKSKKRSYAAAKTGRFQKVCRGQQITIPVIDTQNIAKKLLFWTKALLNASLLKQSKVQYNKRRFIVVLF